MTPPAPAVPSLAPHLLTERPSRLARPLLWEELAERAVDPALRGLIAGIQGAAQRPGPVWIQGESGVGKEYFARRIHELRWGRRDRFECLLGAELRASRLGAALRGAERALHDSGAPSTLYIRNPELLPASTQRTLAAWIDATPHHRRGARPLLVAASIPARDGATRPVRPFDWGAGASVLVVPPLRDRGPDLHFVVQDLVRQLSTDLRIPAAELSLGAWRQIRRRPWHGNVRELLNCLRQAMLLSRPGESLEIPGRT